MRFRHRTTVSLFLSGILILGSGGSGTHAQQTVDGERSLLPVVVPHVAGTATFHNNTVTPIPPTGTSGTTSSTVNVSGFGAGAVVYDVKVSLHLTHTFDSDLVISLIGPGGAVSVPLSDNRGGGGDNYGVSCTGDAERTSFDDATGAAIALGTAPFKGTFKPESPLSAFRGTAPNGTWTLRIQDVTGGDVGALQCWSLAIIPRYDNTTAVAIPDASTVESSVTTTGIQGLIGRAEVSLHITHPLARELDLFLVAPDNTVIELSTDNGNNGANYGTGCGEGQRTTFSSPGTTGTSISNQAAPFTGADAYLAEAPLFALSGRSGSSANGVWKLRVTDDTSGNVGTLQCWSLTVFPQQLGGDFVGNIPDLSSSLISFGVGADEFPGIVTDVNLSTHIKHPAVHDVDLTLKHGASTIELATDLGADGDDYGSSCSPGTSRTTFDDSAAAAITSGVPPFAGSFRPEQALSVFNGTLGSGVWDFKIADDFPGNVGTLRCFSLHLTQELPGDIQPTTNLPAHVVRGTNVSYTATFTNDGPGPARAVEFTSQVPANTQLVSVTPPAGWLCSLPLAGGFTCSMVGAPPLANGATVSFDIVLTILSNTPVGTQIALRSAVASLLDTVPSNDELIQTFAVVQTATPTDLDGDTLPDNLETQFGLSPTSALDPDGPLADPDDDGRTNAEEIADGTHPRGFVSRFFAEGATSAFFDTSIALLNTSASTPAKTLLRFLRANGTTVSQFVEVGALRRATVNPETLMGGQAAEFGTVIESDAEFVADRTQRWDPNGYGSHAERALDGPQTTWYLAEGATHSGFNLFYLIQNANTAAANVQVTYLLPAPSAPVVKNYVVGANSRFNIWVNLEGPALAATDVSAVITSSQPVIVERAMYLDAGGLLFGAGHESAGVNAPALSWFLAEGATGSFFDLFVLIANPNVTNSAITATYLLPNGSTITKSYSVSANSRFNIWVDLEDPLLAETAVSTTIASTNDVPVIVERSMWWPGSSVTWFEAHNSAGSTVTGTKWGLAEGEQGGTFSHETYLLIANTSASGGTARVTLYFEDGTSSTKDFSLAANSRFNVAVGIDFPSANGRRFGAIIESLGASPAQLVVERAVYSNAFGVVWAAGSNALGTRLAP